MPYQRAGGPEEAPAPPLVNMQVEPDKILDLISSYEGVRDFVSDFLQNNNTTLRGRPLAEDEVSRGAAGAFADHSTLALDVTRRFLVELDANIEQLLAAAKTYGLVEDSNTDVISKIRGTTDR